MSRLKNLGEAVAPMFAAGGLGAVARHGLSTALSQIDGAGFPWDQFAANAVGSLIFGLLYPLSVGSGRMHRFVHLAVLVGFMGSFTTFSSYAFETVQLARDGLWLMSTTNLVATNLVSFAGLGLGLYLSGQYSAIRSRHYSVATE